MDVEMVKCVCCGLKEKCTLDYINGVKAKFNGKWLCGLCSEAVEVEVSRAIKTAGRKQQQLTNNNLLEEAVKVYVILQEVQVKSYVSGS